MSENSKGPIVFVVPGERVGTTRSAGAPPVPDEPSELGGRIKDSVRVGARRARGLEQRLTAVPGDDVVVLRIDGGPTLYLHPENARDLFRSQVVSKDSTRAAKDEARPGEVAVPAELVWEGLEESAATRGKGRGFLGKVVIATIEIVTDLFTDGTKSDASGGVIDVAAVASVALLGKAIDSQVDAGLYLLSKDSLKSLKGSTKVAEAVGAGDGKPMLVLVHGTFVDTVSTFERLWGTDCIRKLFEYYKEQVYALDHPTLGSSPIDNALTLAEALPAGARVHLLTHSRGGLVAEVFAKVCGQPDAPVSKDSGLSKDDRAALKKLTDIVKKKDLHVDRIVRVACPSRGTLLASGRLDAYLSVFKWSLELAGMAVGAQIIKFLAAVASHGRDEKLLPGLAAQTPDSSLVKWLHQPDGEISGELRVVAGDIEGDSVISWLKTLVTDAFYWTDHDLVVQTSSMYGGVPRLGGAKFRFFQGGNVTHFTYFANHKSVAAILDGLTVDTPESYGVIGPLSWSGQASDGLRAARGPARTTGDSRKPAVFLLPGILGSNLKVNDKRVWLSLRLANNLDRLKYPDAEGRDVESDGVIEKSYDHLSDFLARTHEVIEFAFDWRKPMEIEARRLAKAVDEALNARAESEQPVRLLAHSMGGLLARTMQLVAPDTWNSMMSREGSRLVMLGTPNGGSWAPMQVLSGDDSFGNLISFAGAPFREHEARAIMAGFPGFLQLQAGLLDESKNLSSSEKWAKLAADDLNALRNASVWHRLKLQLDNCEWGVPSQDTLDAAVALRRRLDEQVRRALPGFAGKLCLVVGNAKFTPDDYHVGSKGFEYLDATSAGDGRVSHSSAMLPGVPTWRLECKHGALPEREEAFAAYLDLLQSGTTTRLETQQAVRATRAAKPGEGSSEVVHVRSRPARSRKRSSPPQSERDSLEQDWSEPMEAASAIPALRISVIHGDLQFVRQPLMVGHYRALKLTGTEAVLDRMVGGTMGQSLARGRYPVPTGTSQVFSNRGLDSRNPLQMPRPESVIVVGLGEEGNLRSSDLTATVQQGVIAWSQKLVEQPNDYAGQFELAVTLIGSGGAGVSVGSAAQSIVQGVQRANALIQRENDKIPEDRPELRWPGVGHLHVVEIYLDRATEAWRSLKVQADSAPGLFSLDAVITTGQGGLARPIDAGYRGAEYDLISAVTQDCGDEAEDKIVFRLDTKRARSEITEQELQRNLVEQLVVLGSNDRSTDERIGRTLFRLLVPIDIEPFLSGSSEMLIELDQGTAGIPWEMLDADFEQGRPQGEPWAIRCKLLRKLRLKDFRPRVTTADPDAHILVIGEPYCDDPDFPRLPAARREAREIVKRLTQSPTTSDRQVHPMISPEEPDVGPDGPEVIKALHERNWRVIHISGHGDLATCGDPRGVVLSKSIYLGPREIGSLRVVPELVFINCCHLAATDIQNLLRGNRASFAASVAEQLIRIGVRCVVAAGWAVEDEAACAFATTFYGSLLRGLRFMEAVTDARRAARNLGGNTWAAYQCYGDPDWTLNRETGDSQKPRPFSEEYAGIASPAELVLALDTIAVRSEFQGANQRKQQDRLSYLKSRFSAWQSQGAVAAAFGKAWNAAGSRPDAVEWYARAMQANDGSASLRAAEQLGNLNARIAWDAIREELRGRSRGKKASGRKKPLDDQFTEAVKSAKARIQEAVDLVDTLLVIKQTMERHSIRGSAYKRLAMIERELGDHKAETDSIGEMEKAYAKAEICGREAGLSDLFYPAMNRMAAQLLGASPRLDPRVVDEVRASLASKVRNDPDFWSVAGETELKVYEAIQAGRLADVIGDVVREYTDLKARVPGKGNWDSVYDQAVFVVQRYGERATGAERAATATLIRLLERFAEIKD